jgi:hypothetical protein
MFDAMVRGLTYGEARSTDYGTRVQQPELRGASN